MNSFFILFSFMILSPTYVIGDFTLYFNRYFDKIQVSFMQTREQFFVQ